MCSRTCEWCGTDISHKRSNARFCDRACKGKAGEQRRDPTAKAEVIKKWREKNPGYKAPSYLSRHDVSYLTDTRCCQECGAEFQPSVSNQLNCSSSCTRSRAARTYEPKRKTEKARKAREGYQMSTYGKVLNDPLLMNKDKYRHARAQGYRSGLEVKVARELDEAGVSFDYESIKITYIKPERKAHYTPDIILPNGIIVELKGRFLTADRQRHLLVKKQHPDLDIRFVFSNPHQRISKQSNTTYAMWCEGHGYAYAKGSIPQEWIDEEPQAERIKACENVSTPASKDT